jgi:GNAT superfamily N-acetyltransferase
MQNYKKIPVKTTYMEMIKKPLKKVELPYFVKFENFSKTDIPFYREIYSRVGGDWGWAGRLMLSDEELTEKFSNQNDFVYIMYIKEKISGFIEILKEGDDAEILYMGLTPDFIGKGYGKLILNYAIEKAWDGNSKRIWLHTCEYDHKIALENYKKAGFVIFGENVDYEYYSEEFLIKRNNQL